MRISDWSSDVGSSDLALIEKLPVPVKVEDHRDVRLKGLVLRVSPSGVKSFYCEYARGKRIWLGRADALGLAEARESARVVLSEVYRGIDPIEARKPKPGVPTFRAFLDGDYAVRSEEPTSELQSLMRISSAVFCLKKT